MKFVTLAALLFAFLLAPIRGAEKPNLIVIFTDDHGWPDIGSAGIHDDLETPHLDALAASGVRARHGYVTAPQCVPSRAGLLAGRSQNRFGVESNGEPLDGFDAERTIAERLQEAGYATGQVGKWHLGPNDRITDHGFDDVYSKNANRPCHANFTLDGETVPMQVIDDGLYHLDACSEAARTFIRRHAESPFFLYLAYRAPHVPLDAPEKYVSRFPGEMPERRRQALAMIAAIDDGVGGIVEELKEHGLDENTLIFFIGDNGAPLKIHKHDAPGGGPGWDGSLNEPLNGEKGMLTEGGIRVPFLVSWPGTIPGGQVYPHPVVSLDVAATALALAGLPEDDTLDGVNLVPYLAGEVDGPPHETLYWRWIAQSAIREGKWKLLRGGSREYLFDVVTDPGETFDLLKKQPAVVKRLRRKLEDWTGDLDPPGLETKPMSETWERYFDFYLDGKSPPPLESASEVMRGWVVRNATGTVRRRGLHLVADRSDRETARPVFLATTKVNRRGPFPVEVRLSHAEPGSFGVGWRLEGQKDFVPGQVVRKPVESSSGLADVSIEVPAEGRVIHLRVYLPGKESTVRRIRVGTGDGAQSWEFGDSP